MSSHDKGGGPVRLSQMIGSPTFRSSAINAVAVIPLLSSNNDGRDNPNTNSCKSFDAFVGSLHRHNSNNRANARMQSAPINDDQSIGGRSSNVVVVVPNSNLTRPGDWKYNETPLKNFHWGHGCQRLRFFDGRPYHSRMAHDRLINHELTRNWIDLCPSRRTAALIGVLNVRDCPDQATLETAIQEWKQWVERYSTPPYEVTAHGRDVARDNVVPRLFVFDSFHEDFATNAQVDLEAAIEKLKLSNECIVAFPPSDQERSQMMEMHVNVVVNNLTVAIFEELESKIKESDSLMTTQGGQTQSQQTATRTGFFGRSTSTVSTATNSTESADKDEDLPVGSKNLSIDALANVVSSNSALASPKKSNSSDLASSSHYNSKTSGSMSMSSSVKARLLTPLDEFLEYTELSPKDAHVMMKREVARRQKFTADLCLLAGSPLDAYERYTKAADLSKTTSPDPLWYASALEGCAAVHIAMADVGGFNVDEYLESSFQLPEELMDCALLPASETKASSSAEKDNKKSMPQVIVALCEDALNVLSRHPKIACFYSELCLKLAWYTAEVEDVHIRCQWGLGGDSDENGVAGGEEEYCYGGDPNSEKRRWEMASATRLNFLELKNKDGDVIQANNLKRLQRCSEYMHRAAGSAALDPVTRTDIALQCLAISWRGIRATLTPTIRERSTERVQLKRKAAFFAVTAAEAMSDVHGTIPNERANAMWIQATQLLSMNPNSLVNGGSYGWATLRAVALHALVIQGSKESSEEAAKQLLMLMSEISPPNTPSVKQSHIESPEKSEGSVSGRSLSLAGARSYIRDGAKQVSSRSKGLFGNPGDISSLVALQSKRVEDEPLEPDFVPMGDFSSDFALRVMGLPSVWSSIRFENCSVAQDRLLRQIYDLRKNIPASTIQNESQPNQTKSTQKLPIEITSISIVNADSSLKLERVEVKAKRKPEESNNSMSTFFNPYAKQEKKIKPTTIPRGEEQYISITFTNKLSIPFDVDSCKLEFDVPRNGRIKAPSISFVVPALAKTFAVRFPFIILEKLQDEDVDRLEVKGICITSLSRSIFLPVGSPGEESNDGNIEEPVIPKPSSFYPRRDYSKTARLEEQTSKVILSPRLEITPPQPKLRVSFASSPSPMDDEMIIPVLLADGEIYTLPKMCISNDTGLDGLGTIEELQISAIGLPGLSEVVLYDMAGGKETKSEGSEAITISANCVGMDADTLNSSLNDNPMSSFLTTKLFASPNMGSKTKGCDITLRFKYRGKSVSPSLQVWRKYEVEVKILRVKGPRIPSLSFRCDLLWDSGYTEMCHTLASRDVDKRQIIDSYEFDDIIQDKQEFVENRLGKDPGIHVCSDQVVIMISVANESSSPIVLTRMDGSTFGFSNSAMKSLTVSKGVSAKFPVLLPRVDRSENVCQELVNMLKFRWRSDIPDSQPDDAQQTGGPMFPANYRVREGVLELPFSCIDTIIDENPIFLSRICKAPCSIGVSVSNAGKGSNLTSIEKADVGKPVDVSVSLEMAKWLSTDLKKRTNCLLSLYCAKQDSDKENSDSNGKENSGFVWIGQTRKNLRLGEAEPKDGVHDLRAKIMFLSEGDYFVSACLTLSGVDEDDSAIKEVWWADNAAKLSVSK